MSQLKYTAYINDKLISFSEVYSKGGELDFPGVQILSDTDNPIEDVIRKLMSRDDWKAVVYLSNSPKRSWEEFVSHFKLQEAAGGLVKNELGEYLLIFRKGKWDLPKGKIDFDESPSEAAIREVKEECGIENLEIGKAVAISFHTYLHKNKDVLKKTHWFIMRSDSKELLVPQTEEDIEKVVWMNENQIVTEVFSNTYLSIKNLLQFYFSKQDLFEANKA